MLIFNASGYAYPDERVASFPQKAERGHVFTDKNYYLCTDIDKDGNFNIQLELPIEGNEDLINNIIGDYGKQEDFLAIPVTESVDYIIEDVRNRGGRSSWDSIDFERLRSGAGGDASVSRGRATDTRGTRQEISGDYPTKKRLTPSDRSAAVEVARGAGEQLGGKEELMAWDKNITPKQKALLRGLNFHEYPTIQELSAANILQNVEKTMDNGKKLLDAEKDRVKQYLKIFFLFH